MNQRPAKRSSLFLLELIVAILFFALASAVCVQVFVGARVKSMDASTLTRAVLASQNAAELFYATDGDLAAVQIADPIYTVTGELLTVDFTQEFELSGPAEESSFRLCLQKVQSSPSAQGIIEVIDLKKGSLVYQLEIFKYLPQKVL